MPFILLMFTSALAVSAIAAYYSIVGLIAIFAAAPLPIAIMGGSLELAKLVVASWLYKNWKEAPKILKYYFTIAVVILMFITSLGIFGYLSKSHIESTLSVGENSVQLKTLNEQEKIVKERLEYLLKRAGDDPEKISRATDKAIQDTQKKLEEIGQKKLPFLKEENRMMAEVGPLKYIAELIYGNEAENNFDDAVRFVIILLVLVFDPLAVLLVVAANYSLKQHLGLKMPKPIVPTPTVVSKRKRTKKIDMTSIGPIPMNKEELMRATNLFAKDE